MPINDFKPFASGPGANVTSQADWENLPALLSGFMSGKASSAQMNKAFRQASFIAAALAQFVSEKTDQDVLDDGDLPGFVEKLTAGFAAQYLSRSNPFGDIALDGPEAIATALENLQLGEAAKVSLGVDQNYVNVTSSRQSGVVYTNSTGKPILVSVSVVSEQNKSPNTLLVNGIEVASCGVSPVAGVYSTSRGALVAVVGNGKTYQISGSGTIISWSELR
ncbi:hypothetical protein [Citrobacter amalonaticus]|uniref:hypothetical protein n=1 Tax=Citrobacter amalonaticus TaxID=35703 RepID=UPI000AACFA31|nr:hypothetical protein [Citrobacter amalonaticus]